MFSSSLSSWSYHVLSMPKCRLARSTTCRRQPNDKTDATACASKTGTATSGLDAMIWATLCVVDKPIWSRWYVLVHVFVQAWKGSLCGSSVVSPHVLLWRWLQHTLLWLTWWTRRKEWKRNISTAKRKILPQGLRRFAQIFGHFVQMRKASFPGDLFAEQRTRCLKVVCTTCIQIQQRITVALLIVFFSWVEIWNQPWVALYAAGNSRFCADGSWVERLNFGVNGFSRLPLPCLELFATACSPECGLLDPALFGAKCSRFGLFDVVWFIAGIDSWLGTPKVKQFIKLWKMCLVVHEYNGWPVSNGGLYPTTESQKNNHKGRLVPERGCGGE